MPLRPCGASPRWKAIRDKQGPDALAWSFVDLDRLRKIDPAKFAYKNPPDTGVTLLFGSWYEAFRKATAATASIRWSDAELAASVDLMQPVGGRAPAFKGYVPAHGQGRGAAHPAAGHDRVAEPVAQLATIWESKGRPVPARDRPGIRPARHVRRPVLRRSRIRRGRPGRIRAALAAGRRLQQDYAGDQAGARRQVSGPRARGGARPSPTPISPSASRWPSRRSSASRTWMPSRRKGRRSSWARSRSRASRWRRPDTWCPRPATPAATSPDAAV